METFQERFHRLVAPLSDTELAVVLGVSADAARKMRRGEIRSLKLEPALRLCERLGLDPYELAFGRPATRPRSEDGVADLAETVSRLERAATENREASARLAERQTSSIKQVSRRLDELEKLVNELRPQKRRAG